MSDSTRKAVILHSGGIDSSTVLAIAIHERYEPCVMSFRYGQRHASELDCARRMATSLGVTHRVEVPIDLRMFGGSALTDDMSVPKDRSDTDIGQGIPITYVPARNIIFLSYALAWAEVLNAYDIFIGVNALDYSGYPDCRPEFIHAYQQMANIGTKTGVEGERIQIHSPLIDMTKAEIIRTGTKLGVDFSNTLSCYDPAPDGIACGRCDSCRLRLKGFAEAGLTDPAAYVR